MSETSHVIVTLPLARVVDILDGPRGTSVVHLDVLEDMVDELRHAPLLPQ